MISNKLKYQFSFPIVFFTFLMLLISGCIEENPDLVNPPSKVEKIYVRMINFSGDYLPRKMLFDNGYYTENINFGASSVAFHPPADSSFLSIINTQNLTDYKTKRIVKFYPSINYSYIVLPSVAQDSVYSPADTMLALSSSIAMPQYSTDAYIKMVNIFQDSLSSFSLMIGCPNSTPIISGVRYMMQAQPVFVRTGIVPISVVRNKNSVSEVIGTFALETKVKGQYAIIVSKNTIGEVEVYTLDELNTQSDAFKLATKIEQRYTNIRVLNISNEDITLLKNSEPIVDNLTSNTISAINQVSACQSQAYDTLITFVGSNTTAQQSYSFEVLENYSIVVADSAYNKAVKSIIIPPARIINFEDKSAIRVVNLAWKYTNIDVSLGTRQDKSIELGYSSGSTLVRLLPYGKYSAPILVSEGELPLTLFTSFEPARLLENTISSVEKNKEYLLIIYQDENGNIKQTLVDNNEANKNVNPLETTSFVQILNALPDSEFSNISINQSIIDAKLYYSNIIATNLKFLENQIKVNSSGQNSTISVTPKINNRYTMILCGNNSEIENVLIENTNEEINPKFAQVRFVNASKDFESVSVVDRIADTSVIAQVPYKESTFYQDLDKLKKYTYYFFNSDKKLVANFSLDVTLGKRYTIVFAGNSNNPSKYEVMLIQEY